jgi:hypothetical protein
MIAKLPGSGSYDSFAYEVALLKDFLREEDDDNGKLTSSMRTGGGRKKRRGGGLNNSLRASFRGGSMFGRKPTRDQLDNSVHSLGSLRGRNNFKPNATVGG